MGTDIHVVCQVKENDNWIDNPIKIFPNPWYNQYKEWLKKAEEKGDQKDIDFANKRLTEESELETYPDDNRSYDWFAILADVRNGRGFAGCITGEGFNIISEPKGFPEDFNIFDDEYHNERWMGYHSHSYLSLEEFEKFDWNQITMKVGIINLETYIALRGTNQPPDVYSGAISGPNIITITQEEADDIIDGKIIHPKEAEIYVSYHWPVIYREWFEYKIKNWIEPMRELAKQYQDVRIVFGFDS